MSMLKSDKGIVMVWASVHSDRPHSIRKFSLSIACSETYEVTSRRPCILDLFESLSVQVLRPLASRPGLRRVLSWACNSGQVAAPSAVVLSSSSLTIDAGIDASN